MRTVNEIKERYSGDGFSGMDSPREYFREFDNPYGDVLTLLDHIATLEAKLAKVQEGLEKVDEATRHWVSEPNPKDGFRIPFKEMTNLFVAIEGISDLFEEEWENTEQEQP